QQQQQHALIVASVKPCNVGATKQNVATVDGTTVVIIAGTTSRRARRCIRSSAVNKGEIMSDKRYEVNFKVSNHLTFFKKIQPIASIDRAGVVVITNPFGVLWKKNSTSHTMLL